MGEKTLIIREKIGALCKRKTIAVSIFAVILCGVAGFLFHDMMSSPSVENIEDFEAMESVDFSFVDKSVLETNEEMKEWHEKNIGKKGVFLFKNEETEDIFLMLSVGKVESGKNILIEGIKTEKKHVFVGYDIIENEFGNVFGTDEEAPAIAPTSLLFLITGEGVKEWNEEMLHLVQIPSK